MKNIILVLAALCVLLVSAGNANAANVYFAQASAGSNNGVDCANAYSATRFNTNDSNWTAGNILHICGTWTGIAGSTLLTTQAAGSVGNPIIILFEPGAVLLAPFFGSFCNGNGCGSGAINVNKQYIIIDGGSNGDIHNTANGTGLANSNDSLGVFIAANNVIVRNLNIHDIYKNLGSNSGATDSSGLNTANIRVDNGATNVTICNSTLSNSRAGIWSDSSGSTAGTTQACSNNTVATGVNYFGNTLNDHCWMISANGAGTLNIFSNDFGTYVNWAFPSSSYHTDGVITYSNSSTVMTTNVYSNYFHGDLGLGSPTGFVFCTYGVAGSGSKCNIFNNVMVGLGSMASSNDALIYFHSADGNPLGPHFIANNTFVNGGYGFDMDGDSTTHYTIYNNIWQGVVVGNTWSFHQESNSQAWATLNNVNGNDYFQLRNTAWNWNGTTFASLSTWKAGCTGAGVSGCDSSSSTGNPNLSVTYTLGAGSAAAGLGINLTSSCTGNLVALCTDKAGVARPNAAWDAGAYQSVSSPWVGILKPVSGSGACNPTTLSSPQKCGIDWSTAGVIGGIPSVGWSQSGVMITATSGDRTAAIQTALNACGVNHYVLLGPGTFSITNLSIPSNCALRGSGTLNTIMNLTGTSGSAFSMGGGGPNFSSPASQTISSGNTAGSTSIVVGSASGISTGSLLAISEINDPTYVTTDTSNGVCTWCDGTGDGGVRARGQIVLVTNVAGTTLTISPGLYTNYGTATGTSPALAYYFQPGATYAGVESLQAYSNGTGYAQVYNMTACENCWVKGVFDNYADGDHANVSWGYHDEFRDSYFSNAYVHAPGSTDADIFLINKTTATLVENNIFERLHVGVMFGWGAAGNVVAYNYDTGNFDAAATTVNMSMIDDHGAHPQFNLYEGNIGNQITKDSFWGTGSNDTIYRNQWRGTDTLASPRSNGRNIVNWSSTVFATQQMMGQQLAFPYTNINSLGNVNGSTDAVTIATVGKYNSGSLPFTSTIVPSASRPYDNFFSAISIGYNTGSDTSGSSVASFSSGPGPTVGYWVGKGINTFFQHGNFDIASNAVLWDGSTTHSLPASFYKSAKPSWFGSVPWPSIGPDVTGGTVDTATLAGHVFANPAKNCYDTTNRDAAGLKLFDPVACYVSGPVPTPAKTLYGTTVQATALNNINVGGPSNWRVAYKFTAEQSSTITGGIYYRITSTTKPGYSGGTLGAIVATINSENAGVPGATLSTCTGANVGTFPIMTCSAVVTAGQNYYLIFTNTDPAPTTNFASADGLYNVGGVADPNFPYTTMINNGGGWTVYPTVQPILQINYSNGRKQGNGYMEVWINTSSVTLSATTWARELFTPTSSRAVGSIKIGPGVVAGTTVTISNAGGGVIATGTLPAPVATGWSTYTFPSPVNFLNGFTYQVILKAAGTAYPIRKGSNQSFTNETYFPDGHAQFSTNSGVTWTDFNDEGGNPSTLGDLEFTFFPVGASPVVTPWTGIIDPSRAIDWTAGGIPAVPVRNTICSSLIPGATSATINAAIAACPAGQVVFLNTGTYNLTSGLTFAAHNNVTLRGAGPTLTILNFAGGDACGGLGGGDVCMKNASSLTEASAAVQPGGTNAANWTAGYAQGSASITLDVVPAGVTTGSVIILDQANDLADTNSTYTCDVITSSCSQQGTSSCRAISGADYCQQQFVTVTGILGTTVTFTPSLYMSNWRAVQLPKMWWTGAPLVGAGIENMTLDHNGSAATVKAGIYMFNCYQCYVKNVRSLNANRNHVWMNLTSQSTVRDSYMYGTYNATQQSFGVEISEGSNNLVENNIFDTVLLGTAPSTSQGNIFGYNFDVHDSNNTPAGRLETTRVSHGSGNGMNLFEGNQTQGFTCDDIHGSSNTATLFRDRLTGWQTAKTTQTNSITFYSYCRSNNVIGNVLGTSTYHTTYESSSQLGNPVACNTSIYNLGYGNSDATCTVGVLVGNDRLTQTTLFRWGNYDTVGNAVRWDSLEVPTTATTYINGNPIPSTHILPASFYLTTRPGFFLTPFGSPPFPPIGPDVTSGNISGVGGFANNIPAELCYVNTAQDSIKYPGTTVIQFDARVCYGTTSFPVTAMGAPTGRLP